MLRDGRDVEMATAGGNSHDGWNGRDGSRDGSGWL
jgi:hypothetical protein